MAHSSAANSIAAIAGKQLVPDATAALEKGLRESQVQGNHRAAMSSFFSQAASTEHEPKHDEIRDDQLHFVKR